MIEPVAGSGEPVLSGYFAKKKTKKKWKFLEYLSLCLIKKIFTP
jgi:hypothetical protein